MREHIADKLNSSKVARGLTGYVLALFGIFLFITLAAGFTSWTQQLYYQYSPREWYYSYRSVEYTGNKNAKEQLIMESVRDVRANWPLAWSDVLYCQEPGETEYSFISFYNSNNESPRVTKGYEAVNWTYPSDYVTGVQCYLRSTGTMTVAGHHKRQVTNSAIFTIE